jgi:hypothetical protein
MTMVVWRQLYDPMIKNNIYKISIYHFLNALSNFDTIIFILKYIFLNLKKYY